MKEAVIDYWSDKCNRKAMAEAIAKEVREIYTNVQPIKICKEMRKDRFEATASKKPFVLIASEDFWGDGQWLRYWEERMKAYGVEVRPNRASSLRNVTHLNLQLVKENPIDHD